MGFIEILIAFGVVIGVLTIIWFITNLMVKKEMENDKGKWEDKVCCAARQVI